MRTRAKVGMGSFGLLLCAVIAMLAAPGLSAAAESPGKLWTSGRDCGDGNKIFKGECAAAGETTGPAGMAADPVSGHIYVADYFNKRISEFTAWGEFVKAWGWGVRDGSAEPQTCTVATTCRRGLPGGGAGQLDGPQGVALDSAGDVYVFESANLRVQKFDPEGNFLLAFGGDVVASGPGDSSNDEVQEIAIAASGGSFKLGFEKAETAPIAYNAPAATVKAALDGLATIGGAGGSVTVSGGPGDATGSSPYSVTFEGSLGGDDVPQLTIDRSGLTGLPAVGTELACGVEREVAIFAYQWLRNGVPIAGATSDTYTAVAADEGKALQCQASSTGLAAALGHELSVGTEAGPPQAIAPAPGTPLPVPPKAINPPQNSGKELRIGGAGGQTLTCNPGAAEWSGSPSFSYRWYRNGVAIAGATASTYVVTAADLSTEAAFQCAVTGTNAAGGVTKVGKGITTFFIDNGSSTEASAGVTIVRPNAVQAPHRGGAGEVCKPADTCKRGIRGSAEGEFWEGPAPPASRIAVGPGDRVYVGDRDRIEEFDTEGAYQGEIELPEEGMARSLAIDPASGDVYFDFGYVHVEESGSFNIDKQPSIYRLDANTGAVVDTLEVDRPGTLATDAEGNLYVVDRAVIFSEGDPRMHEARVVEFDPSGKEIGKLFESEWRAERFDQQNGIATNVVTEAGGSELYVSGVVGPPAVKAESEINAYGPPPEKWLPPPAAPSVDDEYAISVGAHDATLGAAINPHFWKDTTYYLEYGTQPCSEGGCSKQPAPPGSSLGGKVLNEDLAAPGVFLAGLQPGTTYHYRFVAQSSGGGPTVGPEASFTTFPLTAARQPCPNDAHRGGTGAALPDCRAYEMVSPVDKEGGNVSGAPFEYNQSAVSGGALTYTSGSAFAGSQGAPFTNQYLATRDPEAGWSSKSISAPQAGPVFFSSVPLINLVRAFSPDLSTAWNVTYTDPVLGPGGQEGLSGIYRRDNESDGYEACTTATPAFGESKTVGPELQAVSADQQHAVWRQENKLTEDASSAESSNGLPIFQVYECSFGDGETAAVRLVSILPDGTASPLENTAGSASNAPGQADFNLASWEQNAISEDGSRIFWSTSGERLYGGGAHRGPLYLRVNAPAPESAHLHGVASGTGNLIGPAEGVGTAINLGEKGTVTNLEVKSGTFSVGQEISDSAGVISPGTTVTKVEEPSKGVYKLTLSAKVSKTNIGDVLLGLASATVANLKTDTGAFQAGQEISGASIPKGTTVVTCAPSCGGAATSLTLSAKATAAVTAVALSAKSPCTEADRACTYPVNDGGTARFRGATADGSRALFLTDQDDLYLYDTEAAIAGEAARTLVAPKVLGVLGQGENLSRVYLVSKEAIGGEGKAGEPNLYLYEGGEAPTMTFVATLSKTDANLTDFFSPVHERPVWHLARVSPDGETLAFMSNSPALAEETAAYDNTDIASGEADAEVYRYSAATGGLACVSCNPTGARPRGRKSAAVQGISAAARLAPWTSSIYPGNPLSEDGTRVFFESYEPLALADTNGKADVYEWELKGAGDCEEGISSYVEASGGCLSLVSSGKSPADSEFIDASPDGRDVFFSTAQSLLTQDPGSIDIYDARDRRRLPRPKPHRRPPAKAKPARAPQKRPTTRRRPPRPSKAPATSPGKPRQPPSRSPAPKARSAARAAAWPNTPTNEPNTSGGRHDEAPHSRSSRSRQAPRWACPSPPRRPNSASPKSTSSPAKPTARPRPRPGSHPFALTTSLTVRTEEVPPSSGEEFPVEEVKDVRVSFPTGMVGDPRGGAELHRRPVPRRPRRRMPGLHRPGLGSDLHRRHPKKPPSRPPSTASSLRRGPSPSSASSPKASPRSRSKSASTPTLPTTRRHLGQHLPGRHLPRRPA